jgi:hypothetical protein
MSNLDIAAKTPTTPDPRRLTRCRYLGRNEKRCTAEVAEEGGEIELCIGHLLAASQLLARRLNATPAPASRRRTPKGPVTR